VDSRANQCIPHIISSLMVAANNRLHLYDTDRWAVKMNPKITTLTGAISNVDHRDALRLV
jgi:hypothetical protein